MPCSINKLKSRILFTGKNFKFLDLTWEKNIFAPENGGGGGGGLVPPCLFFLYGHDYGYSIHKSSPEKNLYSWSVFYHPPSQHLLVQTQQ